MSFGDVIRIITIKAFSSFQRASRINFTYKHVKELLCFVQGDLTQFSFLASQIHKKFRKSFNNDTSNESIQVCYKNLDSHLNDGLLAAFYKLVGFIEEYYMERNIGPLPRITLKVNYLHTNKEYVRRVFRSKRSGRVQYTSDCEIGENTGFEYVWQNRTEYLCNDIPANVKAGNYKNPRINDHKVMNSYNKPWFGNRWFNEFKENHIDYSWITCWDDNVQKKSPPESCYKSTLIVPLTLSGHQGTILNDEFEEKFGLKNHDGAIFGYLCFDHPSLDYFNSDLDVHMGWVYADLLSMYLFVRHAYISNSETVTAYKKQLRGDANGEK